MKTAILLILPCLIAVIPAKAEEPTGIHFVEGLSWAQVLAKGKAENKMILVDCYATWCGPCKAMDKEVYPEPKVGAYINEHFISVRVQMDTTKKDSDLVKNWRPDAQSLEQQYKIKAYPTFLFFSPEGKALHKAVGGKSPDRFIALAQEAANPDKQYFTQLDHYKTGNNYLLAPGLVKQASALEDTEMAKAIALDYIDHFLSGLDESALATKTNLDFLSEFWDSERDDPALGSSGRIFRVLYGVAQKPDNATGIPKLARDATDRVIKNEEINSMLWSSWTGPKKNWKAAVEKPDWDALTATIIHKYGTDTAERVILNGKITWYSFKKDYEMWARVYLDRADKFGAETKGVYLNNFLCDTVLDHSSDPALLERAIRWQQRIIEENVTPDNEDPGKYNLVDTLANLLYKAGQTTRAIALEEKTIADADAAVARLEAKTGAKVPPDEFYRMAYRGNLEKMKKGLPTWDGS